MPSRSVLRIILHVTLAGFALTYGFSSLDETGQLYVLMFALLLSVVGWRHPRHYVPAAFCAIPVALLISRTDDTVLEVILCNLPLCFIFVAMRTIELENEIATLKKELERQQGAARTPSADDQASDESIRTTGAPS